MPPQRREFRAKLDEHLRLQFVEPAIESAHRPAQVMLGQAERAGDDGKLAARRSGQLIERPGESAHRRAARLPGIKEVADRRLDRLVVRRQRAVLDGPGSVKPAQAVGLHDERLRARERRHARGTGGRLDSRAAWRVEVRLVVADPAALRRVPPDEFFPLRPGPAFGIGRGAVVHDAAIVRPGEAPLRLHAGCPPSLRSRARLRPGSGKTPL